MTQHTEQLDRQQQTASVSSQAGFRQPPQELSQEEMRRRYLEQQRRLACPGCGEAPFLG